MSTIIYHIITVLVILYVSSYLLSYIQTIRNIISFAFLALCLSFGFGLSYNVHYFPIFLMLTYVGAIIVTTLFVVLTFDIRKEYKQKKKYFDNYLDVLVLSNCFEAFFVFAWIILRREHPFSDAIGPSRVTASEELAAFERCVANHPELTDLCKKTFKVASDASFYERLQDHAGDLHTVSSHFYTGYSFLFICLAILLSLALMAAMTILKQR